MGYQRILNVKHNRQESSRWIHLIDLQAEMHTKLANVSERKRWLKVHAVNWQASTVIALKKASRSDVLVLPTRACWGRADTEHAMGPLGEGEVRGEGRPPAARKPPQGRENEGPFSNSGCYAAALCVTSTPPIRVRLSPLLDRDACWVSRYIYIRF